MSNPRILYVGGIDDTINEAILHAAFIPFGDIISVSIPKDTNNNKIKGYGFVEFEEVEDAQNAIDNMHNAELYNRVLSVSIAKAMKERPF